MKKKGVMNFRGKEYKTVSLRVSEFREHCKPSDGWAITTQILTATADVVVMKAEIVNPEGKVIASGHAEEFRSKKGVNSTSALENCETSAIGRALAAYGLAGEEYASADELAGALVQQRQEPAQKRKAPEMQDSAPASLTMEQARQRVEALGYDLDIAGAVLDGIGRPQLEAMTDSRRAAAVGWLETSEGRAALAEVSNG